MLTSRAGAYEQEARHVSRRGGGMILVAALLCTLMRGAKLQESRVGIPGPLCIPGPCCLL